jgi:hypothetical protein
VGHLIRRIILAWPLSDGHRFSAKVAYRWNFPDRANLFISLVGFTLVFERIFSDAEDLSSHSKTAIVNVHLLVQMAFATRA